MPEGAECVAWFGDAVVVGYKREYIHINIKTEVCIVGSVLFILFLLLLFLLLLFLLLLLLLFLFTSSCCWC